MCGLFGIAGPGINKEDLRVFDELMLVSTLRGEDGTGVAVGRNWDKPEVFKIKGDAIYWRYSVNKESSKIYNVHNQYFLGHTRRRTVGAMDVEGSQPYLFKSIVGTHNGMLSWDFTGYSTDSEKLLDGINKQGLQNTINETHPSDAMALVWVDVRGKNKVINFYRNIPRSLYFAFNNKRDVLYWASELWMLTGILGRNDIEYEPYYATPFTHYFFDVLSISHRHKTKKFHSMIIKPPEAEVIPITKKSKGGDGQDLKQIPWMRDAEDDGLTMEQRERLLH